MMVQKGQRATILLEEPQVPTEVKEKKDRQVLDAITLMIYDDFDCDILAKTRIDDKVFEVNANLLRTYAGFLEDVCQGINFGQVVSKMLGGNAKS